MTSTTSPWRRGWPTCGLSTTIRSPVLACTANLLSSPPRPCPLLSSSTHTASGAPTEPPRTATSAHEREREAGLAQVIRHHDDDRRPVPGTDEARLGDQRVGGHEQDRAGRGQHVARGDGARDHRRDHRHVRDERTNELLVTTGARRPEEPHPEEAGYDNHRNRRDEERARGPAVAGEADRVRHVGEKEGGQPGDEPI